MWYIVKHKQSKKLMMIAMVTMTKQVKHDVKPLTWTRLSTRDCVSSVISLISLMDVMLERLLSRFCVASSAVVGGSALPIRDELSELLLNGALTSEDLVSASPGSTLISGSIFAPSP